MKVLIVDDDVVSRMMLMHMIDGAAAGPFDVHEAEDGMDAWRQLDDGLDPAILFCDLRMPRLSGMELLARCKADARFAHLPFVLVSAAGDAATMEQALGLGADGYIVKPFDAARVAAHLDTLKRAPAPPAGIDGHADEVPEATLRRLGIDATRLLLYLGGLQRQLVGARPELEHLLADRQFDAARAHLARLREGCRTLGLHGAAARLDGLFADTLPAGADAGIACALDEAGRAVLRQTQVARRLG
jgi:two-component system chemotaxis response regulator CheY